MNSNSWKTQNTLPADIRTAGIRLLNQILADLIDLGLQAKQAHWNVKGANFIALHKLFDEVYEAVVGLTDEIAERAVELGGIANGIIQVVTASTRLTPFSPTIMDGTEHIRSLSAALALSGTFVRAAIETANNTGDAATADVFTEASRALDKLLWQVEAHVTPQ